VGAFPLVHDNGRMTSSVPAPLRALVVEDEPALAELVADYLARDGFEVERARRRGRNARGVVGGRR